MLPGSKETKLESSNQEASPSASKNTRVVLVPCSCNHKWKCVPTAISGGVDISEVSGCHLLWQMCSQWGSQKLLQGLMSHEITAYLSVFNLFKINELWPYYSKACKPDNCESHNSLKLSFTNIWGLHMNFCWMWIFPWIKLSRHSCFVWDKPGWFNWFCQCVCERLSSFNPKGF